MFRNRFIVVIGTLSLLLVGMATSYSRLHVATGQGASDFHQRHPDWVWTVRESNVVIPVAGGSEPTDYFQRHPVLIAPPQSSVDLTDYYFRQKALLPAMLAVDLTDYYFRHLELLSPSSTNRYLTDYYFRHLDD